MTTGHIRLRINGLATVRKLEVGGFTEGRGETLITKLINDDTNISRIV